jgi:hypothetical protein
VKLLNKLGEHGALLVDSLLAVILVYFESGGDNGSGVLVRFLEHGGVELN